MNALPKPRHLPPPRGTGHASIRTRAAPRAVWAWTLRAVLCCCDCHSHAFKRASPRYTTFCNRPLYQPLHRALRYPLPACHLLHTFHTVPICWHSTFPIAFPMTLPVVRVARQEQPHAYQCYKTTKPSAPPRYPTPAPTATTARTPSRKHQPTLPALPGSTRLLPACICLQLTSAPLCSDTPGCARTFPTPPHGNKSGWMGSPRPLTQDGTRQAAAGMECISYYCTTPPHHCRPLWLAGQSNTGRQQRTHCLRCRNPHHTRTTALYRHASGSGDRHHTRV